MRQPVSHFSESDYAQQEEDYGLVGEERAEENPRRDRRLPAILLTVAAMALFAGGLWFAYVQGTKQAPAVTPQRDGVPLLRADDRPSKVKPDQPGGMKIPDQNVSLYNEKPGAAPVEKLLPQPEQPMARPAPTPEPTPPAAAPQAAAAPAGTPATPSAGPAPSAAAKPAAKAAADAKPPAQPKPEPAAQPKAAASGNGRIEVRLASVRTPENAREEWARLKRENADLLGDLRANAVRADLGDKGVYYRVQAGPLTDAAAAERLCAELKRRNQGCILAR